MRRPHLTLAATMAVTAAVVAGLPAAAEASGPKDTTVQFVAMNDFHGRISLTTGRDSQLLTSAGPDGSYGTPDDVSQIVGGAADVASTVARLRSSFEQSTAGPHTSFFVGAGDLISASPFESSTFKDEPTIEVLNAMGLQASSVGNHEFDRGTQELRRISAATDGQYTDDVRACQGVTPNVDGCWTDSTGRPFHGTDFDYLAANVISTTTGKPMLPPYQVFRTPAGQKVALIGVVTDTTPTIVSPQGIQDVTFLDEATAVNQWVPVLQRQGVQAIGVLVHEGGTAATAAPPAKAYDGCTNLSGPIVDINDQVNDAVDFIVSAHSHQAYNCLLPVPGGHRRLVTQAGYYGRLVTDIRLSINRATGDVDRTATYRATNVAVTRDHPDARVQGIVDYWNAKSAAAGNKIVGSITATMTRADVSPSGETPLGDLVAQAQLEGVRQVQYGNPVVAFMNPGGLRDDLNYPSSPAGEGDGNVTYRELFNVQPFGNTVDTATLTGANLKQVLEQQFPNPARDSTFILGTSDGLRYSYDSRQPYGSRISDVMINGVALDPTATYRVAGNSFLLGGGDSFTAFTTGTGKTTGPLDADTAVAYFGTHSPVAPPPANHATKIG